MFRNRCLVLAVLGCAACAGSKKGAVPPAAPVAASEKPAKVEMSETPKDSPPPDNGRFPTAHRGDKLEEYHGIRVPDPYRWLEDPDSAETREWIAAENKQTFAYLAKIPERAELSARLRELWDFERYANLHKEGRYYFHLKNDGLQNQSVLYVQEALDEEPRVLLDPNQLSKTGTIALSGYDVTLDGTLMAYSLAHAGSDWLEWRVRKVATGEDLPDVVRWSKFSGASWAHDKRGFYYSRYPEPPPGQQLEEANYNHAVYYHRLGTPQKADELIFTDPAHKERNYGAGVSEDGKYLVIVVFEGTDRRTRLYYRELKKGAKLVKLCDDFDASYHFVGNAGRTFFVQTDLNAPRGRLVAIDLGKPTKNNWREIIPQGPDKLASVQMLNGGFVAEWLHDAHTEISVHDVKGKKLRDIALPGIGSATGFSGRSHDTETFYGFTSFTTPNTLYRLDLKNGQSTLVRRSKLKFTPGDFETEQVFYNSKDGTRIPMFLVHKKGLVRNGDNPTYLYGYGGFNVSLTPAFSTALIAWLERGGVYAQPSLRGGGEFGEEWHQAGMLDKKQNVFDDFAAAAEYLIASRITKPARLAIGGGSNGGLLVGASITQHPELFGAAICAVGVLDMLRFHKFTIGHAWISEYGSSDDPAQFNQLIRYSPLHNIKSGTHYPATLIMTADHDDRVVPAHSFKFAAELQHATQGEAPILIRVETKAGHGAGKPTSKLIEEAADRWAFLLSALGSGQ